ncbi:glycosyltransferase family 39 protein [Mycobacterium sp. CBMA293]|nr:glycosyltransferase family 39 protein [Mycolicibacterium sp. CBMA 360]MUL60710.1 glycosyltransferase family 39 protein [Mycolicibacterium sp. CBMA 335]MUL72525.1 glycosyltransferase family 39 protein [Mycolicibacterium sp. CBMA 311]MUL95074.1 glycosyltransferase family 39 protein [Mycolicibacterium sp. CBMA 230]MUM07108.1 glycosyl transferase [Mycolicibacterium sp. CBMA 213]MUM13715.1 glycosyltransferase family 39 protein [Mycolicibacterium sp. CBMA 293]
MPSTDRPSVIRRVWSVWTRPVWERTALLALLAGTAVLYLWALGSSGWANSYYAAAAQAGTQNWEALLFGSFDAGNAITVDKPPAAMWLMGLSGRLFGFSAFSMLLPQALMGVAAVAMLYATVRRTSGAAAGLLAGLVLAVTPVAALMFRFNNPDALLVLLLITAAYCTVRAIQSTEFAASARWMTLTGVVVGLAFLTKMLQAFLPVPALALAFLVAAPFGLGRRIGALLMSGVALVISAGWYIALVSLWPADARPYIAGSTDNSLLQLALGYNGIERITGGDGPGGPMRDSLFFGGHAGITRLFGPSMGVEVSWLLPVALIGLVLLLRSSFRAPRTDLSRAGVLLWGGWLLVTGVVFSFMDGTVHPYYNIALAPAVAALVGMTVAHLWQRRDRLSGRLLLALLLTVSGVWAFALLSRTPDWMPALRWSVAVVAALAAVAIAVAGGRSGRLPAVIAAVAIVAGLAGSASFALYNVAQGHSSGPGSMSGPPRPGGDAWPGGGHGGPGNSGPNPDLENLIRGANSRWAAATIGSFQAGDLELSTGKSLMAIGGFSGGDNSPTLAQFRQYVEDGAVHYFIVSDHKRGPGPGGPGDPRGSGAEITEWVTAHFAKLDVGGATVYDLEAPR